MNKFYVTIFFLIIVLGLSAYQADVAFSDSWYKQGLSIDEHSTQHLKLNYSITQFNFKDISIDNENLTNIHLPGVFLPNDEGMPNLPGSSRYIAIPQGAKAELKIIDYRIEIYSDIEVAPAPRIPLDTEDGPLEYNKNNEIYSRNANYPENFIKLSEPSKLRGVDVVMLGITPFQYNPVSKELTVYRDIKFEVSFSGGNGHFGEDRLRNRWWDPIIKDKILNQSILPDIDYNSRELSRDGAEYLIICQNDPDFLAWADSIKVFRQQQGISTMIVTTTEVGGNIVSAIEAYVDDAYGDWDTPPAAVLLLGDYGTGTSGIVSEWYTHPGGWPNFVSDNKFADVDEDNLPDIVFARITANNAIELETMITKFLDYERNPPIDPDFYNHPITALGWQTERWFQICSEVVGGYFREVLGKNPVRINAIYSGTPDTVWSTATNTSDVLDYFGSSRGLSYIPATPAELGGWSGGTTADVVNAINAGSFMLQHRDHGSYSGWGEPDFQSTDINSLTNVDNKLPFIFSINCQTGAFHRSSETFAEKFHRHTYDGQNSGALGILAATEVSYSFVNDTFVWGVMDNMFPDFMPSETTEFPNNFVMPAFGNAAGKHFLYGSGWPYNTSSKLITYRLFHHHGDAFLNVYTEVPQDLTISHIDTLLAGVTLFSVTADDNSFIALTVNSEIIGTANGTGSPVLIDIPIQTSGNVMLVTVTKQNHFRYIATVEVISPGPAFVVYSDHQINDSSGNDDGIADYGEEITLDMTLENVGTQNALNVNAVLSTTDSYVTISDDDQFYGSIIAGAISQQSDAFALSINSDILDQHTINFDLVVTGTSTRDIWNSSFQITVNAPELTIGDMIIDDTIEITNGRLDPGETVDLIVPTNNVGHSNSPLAIGTISCTNEYITINGSDTHNFGEIEVSSTENAVFSITVAYDAPIGANVTFDYEVSAGSYSTNETFNRMIGLIVEDFETNNFALYPWTFGGDEDWTILEIDSYQGTYCAKSGLISDNQTSELMITGDVTADGIISFYCKVSSESNYDWLKFYIDDVIQDSLAGEVAWSEANYPVTTGSRTFKWVYYKDGDVDNGSDCAWIDEIIFPSIYFPEPANITYSQSSFSKTLQPDETFTDNLTIGNIGESTLDYSASISYIVRNRIYNENEIKGKKSKVKTSSDKNESFKIAKDENPIYRDYCDSYATSTIDSRVDGVQFSDVNTYDQPDQGETYTDWTHLVANVEQGSSYDLTIWGGDDNGSTYTKYADAFIDWNHDSDFDDAGEWIYVSAITVGASGPFDVQSITIPIDALWGQTRMRVIVRESDHAVSGCDVYTYGETEDYTVNVIGWLTLNSGSSIVNGSVQGGANEVITVDFDATGLEIGVYQANITIACNDIDEPTIVVPVIITVGEIVQPDIPINVNISISGSDLTLSWDSVSGASSYNVYSSHEPESGYTLKASDILDTYWTTTILENMSKQFYQVTANN